MLKEKNDNDKNNNNNELQVKLDNIESLLNEINCKLSILKENQQINKNNIDIILTTLNKGDIVDNCKKMGDHINFIEKVYNNVKYPLSFLCNTINKISNNNVKNTLEIDVINTNI